MLISVSCFFHASCVFRCTPKYRLLLEGFTDTPSGNSNWHLVLNCLSCLIKYSNSYFFSANFELCFLAQSLHPKYNTCSFLQFSSVVVLCVKMLTSSIYTPDIAFSYGF